MTPLSKRIKYQVWWQIKDQAKRRTGIQVWSQSVYQVSDNIRRPDWVEIRNKIERDL